MLIHRTDNLNRERNLRYMVVQYEDTDGNMGHGI